jgi:hypothetical protein
VVVLGEAHLRRILPKYAAYYLSELRTHRSLDKDAPVHLAIRHVGRIVSAPASACREASFPLSDLCNETHGDEICSSVPGHTRARAVGNAYPLGDPRQRDQCS